jgi:hypothetical protein
MMAKMRSTAKNHLTALNAGLRGDYRLGNDPIYPLGCRVLHTHVNNNLHSLSHSLPL